MKGIGGRSAATSQKRKNMGRGKKGKGNGRKARKTAPHSFDARLWHPG